METDALHLLLVEDSAQDAEMIQRSLRDIGRPLQFHRVDRESSLREALSRLKPDIVLSDFSMPGFSGIDALRIVRGTEPALPFIFVSGTIGDEMAIEAMRDGATDYVFKDNLRRLQPAILRALGEADERRLRAEAERQLRESETRYRAIVEHTDDWIWESDARGTITYSNRCVETILGIDADRVMGRQRLEFVAPEQRADAERLFADSLAAGKGWSQWRAELVRPDGTSRTLESNAQPILDDQGQAIGFRGIDRNVTERIQQERTIVQLGRIHAVLSALGNAILVAGDREGLLAMVCRLAVEQGRFLAATIIERGAGDEAHRTAGTYGNAELARRALRSYVANPPSAPDETSHHRKHPVVRDLNHSEEPDASWLNEMGAHVEITLPLGRDAWGALVLYSRGAHSVDADELALLERLAADIDHGLDFIAKSERLEFIAYRNALTGLPNRPAFANLLSARTEQGPMTILYLDIIRFHTFNESRGRAYCEDLLRAVALRLQEYFGDNALIAHPGEDHFALAFADDGVAGSATSRITEFLEECSRLPFPVQGESVYADLRCGVLKTQRHDQDADSIERNALSALAEARNTGARLIVYDSAFSDRAQKRVDLEHELRLAVDAVQFELFLQPKFSSRTNSLVGAEALLRWRHPVRGLMSPADFIPLLEETGLILPVGRWVMREVMSIAERWRDSGCGGLRIAINISARELRDESFLMDTCELLGAHGQDHGLDLEITESLLMDDITRSVHTLQAMRDLGCEISIDDFGTGYSSLNYLSRLPVDVLKIDRSFVADMSNSPDCLSLVSNTIALAHALNLRVVAEGVEEEEQAKLLRLLRCDELQGYLLGRPVPVADFESQFIG